MRHLAVMAIPLIVSGCGIPPAISIASYALDGVALVASGKTIKDHALSAAIGQDCSMFRVVSGEPVCVDYEPSAAAAAALAAMPASEEMLAATADGRVIRVASAAPASGTPPVMTAAVPSLPAAANSSQPAAEIPLITTRDGRVILTAARPDAAGPQVVAPPAVVQLSWVPPALDGGVGQ